MTDPHAIRPNARRAHTILALPLLLLTLALFCVLLPESATAQPIRNMFPAPPTGTGNVTAASATQTGSVLDDLLIQIQASFESVGTRLADVAWYALLSLLVIDFTLRAGRIIVGNDSLEKLISGFTYQLGCTGLAFGFIYFVPAFVDFLAGTARRIAGTVNSPDVVPSTFVVEGLRRAIGWIGEISIWSPGSAFYVFAAVISVIVLAVTVAMLIVIWAELYLAAMCGQITLMFAGLSETRQIAVDYINSLVGKAFQLMGLLITVAATGEMTTALSRMNGLGFGAAMAMILLQIISAILILKLPGALEKLVGGKFGSGAANMIGKAGIEAGKAVAGATIGAAVVGTAQATSQGIDATKGGANAATIAKASLQGLGTGARDGGINAGRTVANKDTLRAIGREVARRLGHKEGER